MLNHRGLRFADNRDSQSRGYIYNDRARVRSFQEYCLPSSISDSSKRLESSYLLSYFLIGLSGRLAVNRTVLFKGPFGKSI